jgi:hypothetical protein
MDDAAFKVWQKSVQKLCKPFGHREPAMTDAPENQKPCDRVVLEPERKLLDCESGSQTGLMFVLSTFVDLEL